MISADKFKRDGYVIVKNFLSDDIRTLAYQYCVNKVMQKKYKFEYEKENYNGRWDGTWGDNQAPKGSYSMYGDVLMDTIMQFATEKVNQFTNMDLVATYSYWRLYEKDEELVAHTDRPSCEISTTLCLGKDYDNIDKDYMWSIYLKNRSKEDVAVDLEDGDMMIYRGCELLHWREPLKGNHHAQVFLHYNDKNGQYNQPLDGRPHVGLPYNLGIIKDEK